MTGNLAMSGHKVTGPPTEIQESDSDAASWEQVTRQITAATTDDSTAAGPKYLTNKRFVYEKYAKH